MGNKQDKTSSVTILWAVSCTGTLFWLVIEFNNFCYFVLGHSKISAKCRLYLWGHCEAFHASAIFSWVFTIPCSLGISHFVGFYICLLLFGPFIVFVVWMVHVHSIKFAFHIVLVYPIPILAISGNIILWFLYTPGFKTVYYFNIALVGIPYFSVVVGAGLGSITSSSLNCCKYRSLVFL